MWTSRGQLSFGSLFAVVRQSERVAVEAGELDHGLLELVGLAEHEPHVRRSVDHRAQRARRVGRVDALVDETLLLPAADRRRVALHAVAAVRPPDRGEARVERGDRLDDAHHPGVLLEPAEVAPVGPLDALGQRRARWQVRLGLGDVDSRWCWSSSATSPKISSFELKYV